MSINFFKGEEFVVVQRVFKKTLANDWFERSPENEKDFATFMARAFQQGITDECMLQLVAESAAKQRYARTHDL